MNNILENNKLILMEAAIIEQLRRTGNVNLHQTLLNAPLIYNEYEKIELGKIYQSYIDIALEAEIPFLMCTPTWRANQARIIESRANRFINSDAVRFMQKLRNSQRSGNGIIKIGGMIGCKNDCYKPNEGLSSTESEQFHSWQIDQLALAGVDFLIAETLPNIEEAKGIAKAMERTNIPYIISFVISRDGCILDGTDLNVAIDIIDSETNQNPLGFMVNCAYPTFLCAARQPAKLFNRLIGYQANASSLDHCYLDGADQLEAENIVVWGEEMLELNRLYNVKILGGCCGTGGEHLQYIVGKGRKQMKGGKPFSIYQ
jgi:S-methylmethionine-dependent homocysteine/selenocysteine methylase